jgi:steroid delta-isomerase-like uncharacterized protein
MAISDNIKTVRDIYVNLNNRNLEANDQFYAASVDQVAPGNSGVLSPEQIRMYPQIFINAFPDLNFDVSEVIAQENKVAAVWTATGTHQEPLNTGSGVSIPPTNQKVSVPGIAFYEIQDHKIVSQKIIWDQVTLLTQLGVM